MVLTLRPCPRPNPRDRDHFGLETTESWMFSDDIIDLDVGMLLPVAYRIIFQPT